jgi:nucleoside-diphosphate-sugar epimerase
VLSRDAPTPPHEYFLADARGADIAKAQALLDWTPETPIDEGPQKLADGVTDSYADRRVLEV